MAIEHGEESGRRCGKSYRRTWGRRILLAILGILLATKVAFVSGRIEHAYMEDHSLFYDPMAYIDQNVLLYDRVLKGERWKAIGDEFRVGWAPLRTIPLLLFAPRCLAERNAHLYTAVPAMAIFLVALGWMVEKGSGSLILASSAMLFSCAVQGFYNPRDGLGAYWLDPVGGFLIGAAACSLGLSEDTRKVRWLLAFGIFGSLAVWARSVTGVYLFIACAPIFGAALIQSFWRSPARWRNIVQRLAAAGLPVGVIAGGFYGPRLDHLYKYYGLAGYGYKSTADSLKFVGESLMDFVAVEYVMVCVLVLICGFLYLRIAARVGWGVLIGSVWLVTSTLLFLGLSRQIGEAKHAVVPGLLLMIVGSFWTWRPITRVDRQGRKTFQQDEGISRVGRTLSLAMSGVLLLLSLEFGARGIGNGILVSSKVSEDEFQEKAFFDELAAKMNEIPKEYVWGSYFDEVAPRLRLTMFFRTGAVPTIDDSFKFVDHESYWRVLHPNRDPKRIASLGARRMRENVDVALVFSDPSFASVRWPIDYGNNFNPWSALIAEHLARAAQDSKHWRKLFEIRTPVYGGVSAYLNLSRRGQIVQQP